VFFFNFWGLRNGEERGVFLLVWFLFLFSSCLMEIGIEVSVKLEAAMFLHHLPHQNVHDEYKLVDIIFVSWTQ